MLVFNLHERVRNEYGNGQGYNNLFHVLAATQCRNLLISNADKWQDRVLSVPNWNRRSISFNAVRANSVLKFSTNDEDSF
jgi:hypothetical protein